MNTLLVVDMQNAWLNGDTKRYDKDAVVARINHAAHCMRERGGQVIFILHNNDEAAIGSPGWQLDAGLIVAPGDVMVDKTACDSFADTKLLEQLTATGTRTLFICGMATEQCVDSTVRASLSQGFDVVALADAHTTGDRPHLKATQIIVHHNWTWGELAAPFGRQIRVRTVEQAFVE
ncbi:MAG TPA: isochorismatase family protein [Burkholderiaceae bacterium]|jgi:nicotinamidase-related amidase|nr:isochorismatase family protein [Burkholderiaceae bacterium]